MAQAESGSAAVDSIQERVVEAAVQILIEEGTAKTTTLSVQKKAGVSRGALLHYFPTRAELLVSTIKRLVQMNEQKVNECFAEYGMQGDDLERALTALGETMAHPSYQAELELWAIARNDPDLREALRLAERAARSDLDRVIGKLLEKWASRRNYQSAIDLSVNFLRGLALSDLLRSNKNYRNKSISQWAKIIRPILEE